MATEVTIDRDAVKALVEAGTTERRATAVYLRDQGLTAREVGDVLGITGGAPSALITAGLRDLGRGSEIGASTGGGGGKSVKPKSVGMKALIEAERDAILTDAGTLIRRVVEAESAVHELDGDAVVEERLTMIREQVEALQAEADALTTDPEPYVSVVRDRLTKAADAAAEARDTGLGTLRERAAEWSELTGITLDVDAVVTGAGLTEPTPDPQPEPTPDPEPEPEPEPEAPKSTKGRKS